MLRCPKPFSLCVQPFVQKNLSWIPWAWGIRSKRDVSQLTALADVSQWVWSWSLFMSPCCMSMSDSGRTVQKSYVQKLESKITVYFSLQLDIDVEIKVKSQFENLVLLILLAPSLTCRWTLAELRDGSLGFLCNISSVLFNGVQTARGFFIAKPNRTIRLSG